MLGERAVRRALERLDAGALALGDQRAAREPEVLLVLLDDVDARQPPPALVFDDAAVRAVQLQGQAANGEACVLAQSPQLSSEERRGRVRRLRVVRIVDRPPASQPGGGVRRLDRSRQDRCRRKSVSQTRRATAAP